MKKNIKIIIILLTIFLILSIIFSNVYGFSVENLTGNKVTNPEAKNLGNKAITIITSIGSVLSVIILIILGLKYMLGSVEEKAEYKKTLLPYVIGAAFVFCASVIAGVLYNVMKDL